MTSKVSVIIPAYNAEHDLPDLITSLKNQTVQPLEVILIDDCSTDGTREVASEFFKVFSTPKNSGPAAARNIGIKESKGEYLGFLDSDCRPEPGWVKKIEERFTDPNVQVLAGGLYVRASSFLGKSIAALGYPGGGSIGFDKMWHVSDNGTVTKICTANLAVRRDIVDIYGGFDEYFDYCFEDAYYSHCLTQFGVKIHYAPELRVEHVARETLRSFIRWHYSRGRGILPFKNKVGKLENVLKLRIWSTKNIANNYWKDIKFPFIMFLLFLSVIVQQSGYYAAKLKNR